MENEKDSAYLGKDPKHLTQLTEGSMDRSEIWCFGMVIGLGFTKSKEYILHQTPMPLCIVDDSGMILEKDSQTQLGVIDPSGEKILSVLRKELTLQLFADYAPLQPQSCSKVGSKPCNKYSGPSQRVVICAILYGCNTLFEPVGAFLAKCNLYLQHPRQCNIDCRYRNPHCLSSENGQEIFTSDLEKSEETDMTPVEILTNPIDLFTDGILRDDIPDTHPPDLIRTELHKHQKQALTFMKQRECGWALNGHLKDIWKEERTIQGKTMFRNMISGSRQARAPAQFRGGLLIDAPGLGKSLSILALVASDLELQQQNRLQDTLPCTLLIVPKTLIEMWKDEIKKHLGSPDAMKCCVYYGKDRNKYLKELDKYALVITTYSVVRLEWKNCNTVSEHATTIHAAKWRRVVLDEAHVIREPTKSFAKAVCELQAERRWAVTGTPIQNRLMDLFSLFKFLRCSPFDDLKSFNTHVVQNWRARSDPDSVAKLKALVNYLALRRPKTIIELLPPDEVRIKLDFDQKERENYQCVRQKTLRSLEDGHQGNEGRTFLNALKWVNELRLMCNHGIRTLKDNEHTDRSTANWNAQEAQARFDQLDQVGLARCSNPLCSQDLSSTLLSEAGTEHCEEPYISELLELWCSLCINASARKHTQAYKVCNHDPRRAVEEPIQDGDEITRMKPKPLLGSLLTPYPYSDLPTKIKRLIADLINTPVETKSVVFSSWTKTLDIIQPQLWSKSIRCVRLDGSLSTTGRANVLRVFRDQPEVRVLLATITCGGIGLDLTAASEAYIMEPQWNPMSESQALDRIYRLGQDKKVKMIKYVMKESWEEQVLKLQHRKRELADLTLDGGISRAELTYGRLQYLKELVG